MKTNADRRKHSHHPPGAFWLEMAWPEGAKALGALREKAYSAGEVDAKTKAMIQLACVSLLRCKHCVDSTVRRLKDEHKATDRQIAEVMMVAAYAGAGTNFAWAKEVFDERLG